MSPRSALLTASALALACTLGASQASAAPKTHKGQVASPAQLQREHSRAVKAGDTANDPFNSASSDALNQQQLANIQSAMGQTPSAPSMASAPMTDANTGISSDTSATSDVGNTGVDTSTATTNDNTNNNASTDTDTTTAPPADQPGTPTGSQDNGSTSMPSSSMPSTSSDTMPQSQMPSSTTATQPSSTTSGNDTTPDK